jgi:tmRNA-binding protein
LDIFCAGAAQVGAQLQVSAEHLTYISSNLYWTAAYVVAELEVSEGAQQQQQQQQVALA